MAKSSFDYSKIKYSPNFGYYYRENGLNMPIPRGHTKKFFDWAYKNNPDVLTDRDWERMDNAKKNPEQKAQKSSAAKRGSVRQEYKKMFREGVKMGRNGHLAKWAAPMALRQDVVLKNGKIMPGQFNYARGTTGVNATGSNIQPSKTKWGADIKNYGKKQGKGTVLTGKEFVLHLKIAQYAVLVQTEAYRIMSLHRAHKVFEDSFKLQRFNSNGSPQWKGLASYTINKRRRRKGGSTMRPRPILREYLDLEKSLVLDEERHRIYTKAVSANSQHNKKHTLCYAGWHNEGEGTYGRRWNGGSMPSYVQRQFMGHSTLLDPMVNKFMSAMMKRYLFDSVFLSKA